MPEIRSSHDAGRRAWLGKAAYVAPAILTLQAAPAYAKKGSEKPEKDTDDKKPPKRDRP